jgi:hypothetical protein
LIASSAVAAKTVPMRTPLWLRMSVIRHVVGRLFAAFAMLSGLGLVDG